MDRTQPGLELGGAHVVDLGAHDVAGEQVGSALDSFERAADGAREGGCRGRLGQAGHRFEQDVAAGEQPEQQGLVQSHLADDALLERA